MLKKAWNNFKTRIRNPKVLTSMFSGMLLILVNVGVITVSTSHHIMDAVNTILGLLVGMGVFADPNSHIKSVPVKETVIPVQQPTSSTPTEQQSK